MSSQLGQNTLRLLPCSSSFLSQNELFCWFGLDAKRFSKAKSAFVTNCNTNKLNISPTAEKLVIRALKNEKRKEGNPADFLLYSSIGRYELEPLQKSNLTKRKTYIAGCSTNRWQHNCERQNFVDLKCFPIAKLAFVLGCSMNKLNINPTAEKPVIREPKNARKKRGNQANFLLCS